jgi:hypothetical protein
VFVLFTGSVPELYEKLREVREENLRHSQLVTARYLYPTLTDVPKEKKRKFHVFGKRRRGNSFISTYGQDPDP